MIITNASARRFIPAALAVACSLAVAQPATTPSGPGAARAELMGVDGKPIGTATFTQTPTGVRIAVDVKGLAAGEHGIHFHQNGECAPGPDAGAIVPFGAAGGHFDPMTSRNHGKPEEPAEHAHAGDIPNLNVAADGSGRGELVNAKVTVEPGKQSIMGRSIVIHADKDDYQTDPAGNSGPRIACGVIGPASASSVAFTSRHVLPGSNVFPEGIALDERGMQGWTGSSSQGDIYKFDLQQGKAELLVLGGSPGREGAYGMKVDTGGKLWVASGPSGAVAVLNTANGQTERVFKSPKSPHMFLNDLVISQAHVYVTDSFRPILFRGSSNPKAEGELESWIDLSKSPIKYQPGFNLNGIVASRDGRQLLTIQSVTGQLWQVDTNTKAIREVKVTGGSLVNGDGLVLDGNTLYVIRNQDAEIAKVELDSRWQNGQVVSRMTDARLRYPTTAVKVRGGLLVVNAQTHKSKSPPPVLPFDVVGVDFK